MRESRYILFFISFIFSLSLAEPLHAQLGFELDIKKPAPYEDRELKAEKTGQKKFTASRRAMQNMTTHFNYFFNANTKLNEIIDRAKASYRDDYSILLPFYNYSLITTTRDSAELDSVIYKSKTAIVLHDLRNDWIDDMYLIWGASYYLQQQYDSAYQMFQFINYAFADKEKDGYYKYIGSNMDGNSALSIATKENNKFPKSMVSEPPSRNTAFIWQIRTLIQQNALPEAGSLIATLKNDPFFPKRLNNELEEVHAWWFYKQGMWDSAAIHLVNALDGTKNKQERARWEYLAAQLFEQKGLLEQAKDYYTKSIAHTTDPVLDIYARLNLIRINKKGGEAYIDNNIATLLKMAKKDKYLDYRDVIYGMAAQMELERGNVEAAQSHLLNASKYKTDNPTVNNRAYLQLAELSFAKRDYKQAASFYDSVRIENLPTEEAEKINSRKTFLKVLASHINTIERQDSLQRIASLPEGDRAEFVKKLVRQLRRQQGLREEESVSVNSTAINIPDPFTSQQTKGEWYFYNANLKATGLAAFKQVWGTRPNVDNWRRATDVTAQLRNRTPDNTRDATGVISGGNLPASYDVLMAQLPITPEKLQFSNDSILKSFIALGNIYVNELEDYVAAIAIYEQIRNRFPQYEPTEQMLFQLYRSYTKTGNNSKADEVKRLLLNKYPASRSASIITTGKDPASAKPSAEVTKTYEDIYDLMLEGKFAEAKVAKQKADSTYQTNYWSPQLLYIEAVYHIKQNEDSVAMGLLAKLIQQNNGTPIGSKAENLVQVLSRRKAIEEELTQLQITRPIEDSLFVEPMPVAPQVQRRDEVVNKPKDTLTVSKPLIKKPIADTVFKKTLPVKTNSLFTFNPAAPHYAVVVLNKVDIVFGNEAKNAFNRYNREKFYSQPLQANVSILNDDTRLLLIGNFVNAQGAIEYIQKAKPVAGSQIVPWLKADKYSFSILSEDNLKTIIDTKDFAAYQRFLDQNLPVKF
ncbi:MAG: hypothetical protein ABR503_00120 [Chitinophagaceae bacterium]